ncbi:hypothetical protein [Ktedonobacter robiniae]|uniref:Polymerase nucleotidyl transferase domain-containing protein n=1 Tax=Ktedonobacter robiniae TaxID=2778365 RepID=A0ABQ3UHQ8_9CHLR|nr:hypothetical protein [Ktedonobacter robiniae]GHO52239.1 hypothetical protein KSB_07140 [Ktedonobacter robiniae]
MPYLQPAELEAIFPELIALLQEELGDDLQGILATGSYIHGTPGPTSDLDVHVVIASPRRRRKNIVFKGLEIEMFLNPTEQIRRYMAEDKERGIDQHMFAFGRAIYDPHGIIAELQREARLLWEAGPPELSADRIWYPRYILADLLRDVEDLDGDEEASYLLIAHTVESILHTHYTLHHLWSTKPKRLLSHLASWDAETATLARNALKPGALETQRQVLQQLAEHVLAPIGGLMPLEWSIEWGPLG